MIVELHAKTDVGRIRSGNEDNFLVLDLSQNQGWTGSDGAQMPEAMSRIEIGSNGVVLVVSDGMGGALAGDVASRMAVETVRDTLLGSEKAEPSNTSPDTELIECLCSATETANHLIHRRSQQDARYSGMGTTLTGAAITPDGIDFVQVGDSRGYVIRGREIKLATKDQSLVQQLVDVGQINEQEAETHMFRNVILQALGAQAELSPVTGRVRVQNGDILLLCSDGLSGKLRAEEMRQIVTSAEGDLTRACEMLVREANERGGEDNITVILAKVTGTDLPIPDSEKITVELLELSDAGVLDDEEEDETKIP
ncbi:MAG TPA: PP2C family serine/threonine-protein phosphatase [Pyrinomonadaceae bacterium]|jgi:protein phosphatase|nr:PP2C family serine/threonine-protein phosphatase [Pyrinomonadaceae bacterium]